MVTMYLSLSPRDLQEELPESAYEEPASKKKEDQAAAVSIR